MIEPLACTDKYGQPVDLDAIMRLLNDDPGYRAVALFEAGGWTVHTVWLGPHVLDEDGMRFGTALLSSPTGSTRPSEHILEVQRYPDLAAAERGHDLIVAWLNSGGTPLISQTVIDGLFKEPACS